MLTTARREGDAYVLNGQKNWISYATRRRPPARLRQDRPVGQAQGHLGVHRRARVAGRHDARHRAQARRLGGLDGRALLRERRGAGREPGRRGGPGLRDRDVRARPGPVHGRGRRVRRRARVPGAVGRVRARAGDVRAADRQVPVRPGHDRGDGARLRDVEAARDAGGVDEEPGRAEHARDVTGQVARDRVGVPGGAPRDPGARRVRLLGRVRDRALLPQRAGADHLRGHDADPQADAGRARARLPAAERRRRRLADGRLGAGAGSELARQRYGTDGGGVAGTGACARSSSTAISRTSSGIAPRIPRPQIGHRIW